jgi:hypothetical protein
MGTEVQAAMFGIRLPPVNIVREWVSGHFPAASARQLDAAVEQVNGEIINGALRDAPLIETGRFKPSLKLR